MPITLNTESPGTNHAVRLPDEFLSRSIKDITDLDLQAHKNTPVYPTGLQYIDRMISGGMAPGTVTLVPGRSGAGKTAICIEMSKGLLSNPNVIFIGVALDDSVPTFYQRLISSTARIPIEAVKQSHKRSEEAEKKYQRAVSVIQERFLPRMMVLGSSDVRSLDILESVIGDVFQKTYDLCGTAPQIVCLVDSTRNIDLSSVKGLVGNSTAASEYTGKKLKAMNGMTVNGAYVEPIFLVTEHVRKFTPGTGKKRPTMDDLKDSIGPQYDANLFLSVWCDASANTQLADSTSQLVFERTDMEPDCFTGRHPVDGIVEVHMLKNKMGRMNYGSMGSNLALFKFYQDQVRVEPIEDSHEFMRYVRLI